ncbi:DegT/DnrJ/EryC1/StrS family aminotransferase [Denitrobaculum tricleocarpae]|uniref:DegT/DnrJ/EryC1/StrS aminotransferase n=1 Tax=Denitrobaculum tricleocarpae TaxID=2591009 RepID=A0A545T3S4_9PROT|nr:DegT/DnrJ/EryC1/StrS family aminotransferase [Denitrobaculum tricleocarpae]TQV71869.1 hypothetical protein FKG95_26175 [Denitrobaculum tricleocarpae]
MRPQLPTAARIAPYLEEIDASRWYSNFGPLAGRFEERLSSQFGSGAGSVLAVANGTLGLTLALQAAAALPGDLCMLPAFTFSASASAVMAAGLTPWFVDVDPGSWALEPALARDCLPNAPGRVAAVMPVSVFGRPVDVAAWDEFSLETGIPAVIDGAASFDAARVGQSPVMISLHGTKVFGVGEGGLILSRNKALISQIRSLSSFGFPLDPAKKTEPRAALLPGLNAKFSEYCAAVGLAGLEDWPATRQRFLDVRDAYYAILENIPELQPQPGGLEPWVSATINFAVPDVSARTLIAALAQRGIAARRWWGDGCATAPAFDSCPRTALPVTEGLTDSVIGLPFYIDMTRDDIHRVKTAVIAALRG